MTLAIDVYGLIGAVVALAVYRRAYGMEITERLLLCVGVSLLWPIVVILSAYDYVKNCRGLDQ